MIVVTLPFLAGFAAATTALEASFAATALALAGFLALGLAFGFETSFSLRFFVSATGLGAAGVSTFTGWAGAGSGLFVCGFVWGAGVTSGFGSGVRSSDWLNSTSSEVLLAASLLASPPPIAFKTGSFLRAWLGVVEIISSTYFWISASVGGVSESAMLMRISLFS